MAVNWLKQWLCGDELDTLRRYRAAVETNKAASSHDQAVTAWSIYHEAEGTMRDEWQAEIDRRSHPLG